jgi:translation elongation factor EF-G
VKIASFQRRGPGEGYSFESRLLVVPSLEAIPERRKKGILAVMDNGPLAGFPVIDFKVILLGKSSTMLHSYARSKLQHVLYARA